MNIVDILDSPIRFIHVLGFSIGVIIGSILMKFMGVI